MNGFHKGFEQVLYEVMAPVSQERPFGYIWLLGPDTFGHQAHI